MNRLVLSIAIIAALAGCGGGDNGGTGGTGGLPAGGTGGGGIGGTGGGGTGGGTGGVGGTGGGGTGGTGGGAGTGGVGAEACAADSGFSGAQLHQELADLITVSGAPCAFSSCHAGPSGKAGLVLDGATDLNALLVDVSSCEAPNLPLVTAGDPDASWLWQKLVAPVDSSGNLEPQSEWGAAQAGCGQTTGGESFGTRMPQGLGTSFWDMENLVLLCDWIQAGAPGP